MTNNDYDLTGIVRDYLVSLDAEEVNDAYFTDVALWCHDRLGIDLWYKQVEASNAVVHNKNVAIKAGHGVGKSFWAAMLTCWWIDTRPIERVFVATTAPSADQVTGILWREIRKAYQLSHKLAKQDPDRYSPLPGYITQDNKWKDDLGNIIAQGRKPPDNKAEDAFQGFHDGHVLAIGDEACGLSASMIDGLANITSNNNSRRVLIGNPTNPLSHFGKIFKDNSGAWVLQTISVMDSPNFHGRGRCQCHANEPVGLGMSADALGKLTNDEYVEDKKKEYGEDSPRYKSRVLGEFAYDAGNTLFSEYDLACAKNTIVFPDLEEPWRVLGVDIARMGQDSTYVYLFERGTVQETDPETGVSLGKDKLDEDGETPLVGGKLRLLDSWKDAPFITREIEDKSGNMVEWKGSAERIHELAISESVQEVRIDASGLGHGVIDPLFVMARGRYRIIEVYGSGETPDRRAYHNQRAYQYSEMRRKMFQGLIDLDPADEQLVDELGGIQYGFSATSGGMLIEAKEAMKKRGVHSPDSADAAYYACSDQTHLDGPQPGDILTEDYEDILHDNQGWYQQSYEW